MKKNTLILVSAIILSGIIFLGLIIYDKQGSKSFLSKYYLEMTDNKGKYSLEYIDYQDAENSSVPKGTTGIYISGKVISSTSTTGINGAEAQCEISYNDVISGETIIIAGIPSAVKTDNYGVFEKYIAFSVPVNKSLKYHCAASVEGYYAGYEEKTIGMVTTASSGNVFSATIILTPSSQQTEVTPKRKIPSSSKSVTYKIKGAACELDIIKDNSKSTCSTKSPISEAQIEAQIYPYGIEKVTVTCTISGEAVKDSVPQVKTIKTEINGAFEEEMIFNIYTNKEFSRICEFSAFGFLPRTIQKFDSNGVIKNTTEEIAEILQRDPATVQF